MTTRALVVEAAGNLWGSERALLDLLKSVSGLEAAVCIPPGRPLKAELEKLKIRTFQYYIYELDKKTKWQRIGAAFGVLLACLRFRPHVIYLNHAGSYKIAVAAAVLLKLPVVVHVRIFEDSAYLGQLNGDVLSRLRAIIAISAAVEAEVRRFMSLDRVPLYRIYDSYVRHSEAAETLPGAGRAGRIACVGRLVPIKGQDILVRALQDLETLGEAIECLMVGEGDQRFVAQLKQLAADCGVASKIRWLGFVDEVVPLLQSCSILVCPSHREPLGRVIFEAWDAGAVPVVWKESAGAAEIIAAAEGGILYAEQTPESLAQALCVALRLPQEEVVRLVENGRSWMRKQCDPVRYGRAIVDILRTAAS
jgi:glycosyltransferase involved in cell wall biosynthesis